MIADLCTLCDAYYLPRALVLHESLREHVPDARLRVLCMDEATKHVLDVLALPMLEPIALEELEARDHELAAAKKTRTRVEYCWTAASAFALHCLRRDPTLPRISYLDADMRFYADSAVAFAGLEDASIVLTEHRYARRWQWLERDSGPYNVQLVGFRRDEHGLAALGWWRERCIEWCYDRVEEGRYGDQRYLDDWPERFGGVRVLEHPGAGLGPWSSGRLRVEADERGVRVDGRPLLFHHFHGLRIFRARRSLSAQPIAIGDVQAVWASDYPISRVELESVWQPYVEQVARQTERVWSILPELRRLIQPETPQDVARRLALRLPAPLPQLLSRARRFAAARRPVPATRLPESAHLAWAEPTRSRP